MPIIDSIHTSLTMATLVDHQCVTKLFNIEDPSKCVGHAASQGRKCQNLIAAVNRQQASRILSRIESLDLMTACLQEDLEELAPLLLCRRYHQDQALSMVSQWMRQVEEKRTETIEQSVQAMDSLQSSSTRVNSTSSQTNTNLPQTTITITNRSALGAEQLLTAPTSRPVRARSNERSRAIASLASSSRRQIPPSTPPPARPVSNPLSTEPTSRSRPPCSPLPSSPSLSSSLSSLLTPSSLLPSPAPSSYLDFLSPSLRSTRSASFPTPFSSFPISPLAPPFQPARTSISTQSSNPEAEAEAEAEAELEAYPNAELEAFIEAETQAEAELEAELDAAAEAALQAPATIAVRLPKQVPTSTSTVSVRRRKIEGDCSICLEPLATTVEQLHRHQPKAKPHESKIKIETLPAAAAAYQLSKQEKAELTWCEACCGQNFHRDCIYNWLNASMEQDDSPSQWRCPSCRTSWSNWRQFQHRWRRDWLLY